MTLAQEKIKIQGEKRSFLPSSPLVKLAFLSKGTFCGLILPTQIGCDFRNPPAYREAPAANRSGLLRWKMLQQPWTQGKGRGSPKQALCAPRYGPDGSPLALSRVIYCFSTAEIVPEVTLPNKCLAQTGPSWDLPTTSPLLALPWGMNLCDFSRPKFKSPSVLSSRASFYLRQAKGPGYVKKDRGTRENQKLWLMNKISVSRLCSK